MYCPFNFMQCKVVQGMLAYTNRGVSVKLNFNKRFSGVLMGFLPNASTAFSTMPAPNHSS